MFCCSALLPTPNPSEQVLSKGRLGPGQMIACDLVNGGFEDNWSIKQKVAAGRPYGDWLKQYGKVQYSTVHTRSPALI